jgi:hypothetical protein
MSAVTAAVQAYRETSEFAAQEAAGYDSAASSKKEGPQVTPPVHTPRQTAVSAPATAMHSAQQADDERVLHRFEFPDGGFVEIKVSRDVDAELALQLVEASLPSVKAITAIAEKARKTSVPKVAEEAPRKKENEVE